MSAPGTARLVLTSVLLLLGHLITDLSETLTFILNKQLIFITCLQSVELNRATLNSELKVFLLILMNSKFTFHWSTDQLGAKLQKCKDAKGQRCKGTKVQRKKGAKGKDAKFKVDS